MLKVLSTTDPIYVSGGKKKQDIDHSGTSKVTLWEQYVDSLRQDGSYTLKNFVVREYASQNFCQCH